jgi:tRNA(Ile)-lysidine synthase
LDAIVLTAHTRDDEVETVLIRALRGAGARGLAGLHAASSVRRPFLDVTRRELLTYALAKGIAWLDDPTNESRRHLRNRIRHDLLPALRAVRPTIDAELVAIAAESAAWRSELATFVDLAIDFQVTRDAAGVLLDVDAGELRGYSKAGLGIIWPELASRVGLAIDARGTRRAAEFTNCGRVGGRIQISGGWELFRSRHRFELRRKAWRDTGTLPRALEAPMTWERWTFSKSNEAASDVWRAALPVDRPLWIRPWRAGDRLIVRHGERVIARKVKYFLSDAGISGHIRARWPVVLAGDEIVWIPGVRRSDAATARSGGPVVIYVCDYLDRRS